jgi:hypothetical protein
MLRVHEAKGTEFQGLFERVMQLRYPKDFLTIKPYGNVGDRKNDGYLPSSGTYHQVYAPEQPQANKTVIIAAKKAKTDFEGLKRQWNHATPIKAFRFVFNDEYTGCPADVALACTALAKQHKIACMPFLAQHLEDEAMKLTPDQILEIIRTPIPRPDLIPNVDFSVLTEIINHVMGNPIPITKDGVLKAPDFTEKIEFNGLSTIVGHLLHTAGRQIDAVNDYFSRNSNFAKQSLRDKLNALYVQSKTRFRKKKDKPTYGDLVFFDLLGGMISAKLKSGPGYVAAQTASLVVMGYYFESCDVFETPNATP